VPCSIHEPVRGHRFCPTCGKVYDLDDLRRVGRNVQPRFIGHSSLALEKFWHTGNPRDADNGG
jgi:hypothetical protein